MTTGVHGNVMAVMNPHATTRIIDLNVSVHGEATVQEEIGLRGARTASYKPTLNVPQRARVSGPAVQV